jgi:hypothetical protein
MPFTEQYFANQAQAIIEAAEDVTLFALRRLRFIAEQYIDDPSYNVRLEAEMRNLEARLADFQVQYERLMDERLALGYLHGIERANAVAVAAGTVATAGAFRASGILTPETFTMPISATARKILEDYPAHHTAYGVFQRSAYDQIRNVQPFVIRQQRDRIRDIAIQAGEFSFRESDVFTRRQFTQQLMRRYSDEGITAVMYRDGRTMKLDSYCEMVSRTMLANASRQSNMYRLQENGIDLVQISQHFPTSDLCEPWQARVYSIGGGHPRYPSLQQAIDGGLYHANCKHSQSGYVEGVSKLPDQDLPVRENREQYQNMQQQRYQERQIRSWKRREASAVSPNERDRARQKIKEWQARQRQFVKDKPYLRRDYTREAI